MHEIYVVHTVFSEKVIEKGLDIFSSIHLKVYTNIFC